MFAQWTTAISCPVCIPLPENKPCILLWGTILLSFPDVWPGLATKVKPTDGHCEIVKAPLGITAFHIRKAV